ncbi:MULTISPECIES: U32 family peptidase [unclassified Clostridium]|uniref:U32 family peptidase n=1 Tax=Clostridium TaxID=1485 RepID=UPI001C8B83E5|nr:MULTISPECIES: U32 family peptidase [unclassified Clostridium]MBX9137962.1 peptidase U32 [Clostridium sp. K12(2020)]MBX9144775.1 peptidase U32 [Clostridium sp. K13]MDU2290597.1 U32 family peptidase [Clostridium celatum]MDU4326967.1 U32 family peptidase [Clostridium celatum]
MKIIAGLGCIDDYIKLVKAGADEVFCGYVPYEWNKKYGSLFPLNRREVLYYNIQINSLEDMKILKKMVDKYKVPVSITFNYLYYIEEQYEEIINIMNDLINIGFDQFIIADIALILYIRNKGIKCFIHLSGECSEINSLSMEFFNEFNIDRYVFHRKNTIKDMESCIRNNKVKNLEYEAFILNEKCHYSGAFCSSLHCDEMSHLCTMYYNLAKISEEVNNFKEVDEKYRLYYEQLDNEDEDKTHMLGSSGCGICSLKKLKDAGVTHLKVVGRGKYIDYMEEDIKKLKIAIDMINDNKEEKSYENSVENIIFNSKCSGNCYY